MRWRKCLFGLIEEAVYSFSSFLPVICIILLRKLFTSIFICLIESLSPVLNPVLVPSS